MLLLKLTTTLTLAHLSTCYYGTSNSAPTPVGFCGIDLYDVGNLSRVDSWRIYGKGKSFCLNAWDDSATCSYTFSFCKSLQNMSDACNGGAVCQVDLTGGIVRQYKIAGYNSSMNPFYQSLDPAHEGFTAQFPPGESVENPKTNVTKNVTTAIIFTCNKHVPWKVNPDEVGGIQIQVPGDVQVTFDQNLMEFSIQVEYAGACLPPAPTIKPIPSTIKPIPPTLTPSEIKALSAGSVLLIIFFCCLVLYCAVGCTYNACKGSRGAEMMPNYKFWSTIPGYTKGGIQYVILCGCCQQKGGAPTQSFNKQTGYDSI